MTILYYVHDPMCSWCWAFEPKWSKIRQQLPETITTKYLLGGLAADTLEPMPLEMQQRIAGYWHSIQEKVPGTRFNFNFWSQCTPRRSTYPACRAVIAAKNQNPAMETDMIKAIQHAYYLEAQNPSDDATLIRLADMLELECDQFKVDLNSTNTIQHLKAEIALSKTIGARGFPSLILFKNEHYYPISIDYNDAQSVLAAIYKYR